MGEVVVSADMIGSEGVQDKLLGMADFVKLFPNGPSESVLAGYCQVLTSHYSAVTSHYSAVTSYYSAVAELAKERNACRSSVIASSDKPGSVDDVSAGGASLPSSRGKSVSVDSSASTGKQAKRARRRLRRAFKAKMNDDKRLRMSSSNWRSDPVAASSAVSKPSATVSAISACADERGVGDIMRRKHDAVETHGKGFCYLYAVRDGAMTQMAKDLGPDPLFSDLLAQPVELFESIGSLAALRVDVSSGNGHVVSSFRSGLTRLWTLCCSANWRDYAPGTLGFATKPYIVCGATFVRETEFRLGASDAFTSDTGGVMDVRTIADGESVKAGMRVRVRTILQVLFNEAKAVFFDSNVHRSEFHDGFRINYAGVRMSVEADCWYRNEEQTVMPVPFEGIEIHCFGGSHVAATGEAGVSAMCSMLQNDRPFVFVKQRGLSSKGTVVNLLGDTVGITIKVQCRNVTCVVWLALERAGLLGVTSTDNNVKLDRSCPGVSSHAGCSIGIDEFAQFLEFVVLNNLPS